MRDQLNDDAIDDIRYDIDDYDVCWWCVDREKRLLAQFTPKRSEVDHLVM